MIITGLAVIRLQISKAVNLLIKYWSKLHLGKVSVYLCVRSDKASWL